MHKSFSRDRVLVYGYYGKFNFGDELFVDVMRASATAITGHANPVFLRNGNEPRGRVRRCWHRWTAKETRLTAPLRAIEFIFMAIKCRNIAFCGGSLFSRFSGTHAITFFLVKMGVCKVSAYGVSVGPAKSVGLKNKIVSGLAVMSNPLVLRDTESEVRVAAVSAFKDSELGGDLVALSHRLTAPRATLSDKQVSHVVYIPCSTSEIETQNVLKLAAALPSNVSVVVASVNSHADVGDDKLAKNVAATLVSEGFDAVSVPYSSLGIDGVIALLSSAKYVISERLHGAIVAYLLEVPFAIYGYHEKCADFAATIGLSEDRFIPASGDVDHWARVVKSLSTVASPETRLHAKSYIENAQAVYLADGS